MLFEINDYSDIKPIHLIHLFAD